MRDRKKIYLKKVFSWKKRLILEYTDTLSTPRHMTFFFFLTLDGMW